MRTCYCTLAGTGACEHCPSGPEVLRQRDGYFEWVPRYTPTSPEWMLEINRLRHEFEELKRSLKQKGEA